jgi:potassium/hydrogen antiporter
MAGYAHSALFFDIVFFVVLTSALLQGRTLMPVARWLRVDAPLAARPRSPLEFERRSGVQSETREIDLEPGMAAVGRSVAQLGLPRDVLILLIRRGTEFIVPRGHTVLEPYDTLQLLADRALLPAVIAQLEQPVPESVPAS